MSGAKKTRRLWLAIVLVVGFLVIGVSWMARDQVASWVIASQLKDAGIACNSVELEFDGSDATLAPTTCTLNEGAIESFEFDAPVKVTTDPAVVLNAESLRVVLRESGEQPKASDENVVDEVLQQIGATRTLTKVLVVLAKLNSNKMPATYAKSLVVERGEDRVVEFSDFGLVQDKGKLSLHAKEAILAKDGDGSLSIKKAKIEVEGETAEVRGRVRLGTKVVIVTVAAEVEVILRATKLLSSPTLSVSANL